MSKCQESEPQVGTFLFIDPQGSKSRWALLGRPDVPLQPVGQRPIAPSHPLSTCHAFETEPPDLNDQNASLM
jgi:hypothetical protein